MLISKLSHRGIGIFAGILLIVIYYVPFMIMGDLSYITIHDNLDPIYDYMDLRKVTVQAIINA